MVTAMLAIESWNVRWNDGLDRADQTIHGGHAIPLPFETVAPFNYFTSTGICQVEPRYQLSVTRVTRVIAVPSFPFFSFSLSLCLSFSLRPRFMSSSVRWQRFVIAVASTFVRQIGREGDTERRFASRSSSVSIFSLFFFFFFFFVLQISTSSEP